jgi:hypothetical protein
MSHIFISYSHKDSEYAYKLARALKQEGFSVWIDDRIDYGTEWPSEIEENLDKSGVFIVIMTPNSKNSNWVQNELTRAERLEKQILPLLLEGEIWLSVEALQYVNVMGGELPPKDFYERISSILGLTKHVKDNNKVLERLMPDIEDWKPDNLLSGTENPPMSVFQIYQLESNIHNLLEIYDLIRTDFQHPWLYRQFKQHTNSLLYRLEEMKNSFREENVGWAKNNAEVWKRLSKITISSNQVTDQAVELLGGMALWQVIPDKNILKITQSLVDKIVDEVGIPWFPEIIINQQHPRDLGDEIIYNFPRDSYLRFPITRWDIWHLPLTIHDYGYWIAKQGNLNRFDQFVDAQIAFIKEMLDHNLSISEKDIKPTLSAIQKEIEQIYQLESREQNHSVLERLINLQKIHIWHLIADAFATFLVGPAYAFAIMFLTVDPTNPFLEGQMSASNNLNAASTCHRMLDE